MRTLETVIWGAVWTILVPPLGAQDTISARVVKQLSPGAYEVVIRGDTMLAITQDAVRRSLQCNADLKGALAESHAKDSLIATYERAAAWSDSTVARQRTLIAELDSLYRGYRNLASGYKRLGGEPWLTFEGGLGASGSNHSPAIVAGVGIRSFRIWGFLQEANAGGLLGVSLRLF
jgi:hypothetical protein